MSTVSDNVLQITLVADQLAHRTQSHRGQTIATFRSATVVTSFPGIGRRDWQRLQDLSVRLRLVVSGKAGPADLLSEEEQGWLSEQLFRALFPDDIARLYDVARTAVGGTGLEIRLLSTSGDWANLPWELAWDPLRKCFLATDEALFVRGVFSAVPAELLPKPTKKLRILILASTPAGTAGIRAEDEIALIKRGFQVLSDTNSAVVDVYRALTPEHLDSIIKPDTYDILHFIGHGVYEDNAREGFLIFEDERGQARKLAASVLREIIPHRGLRLVFLNACNSGRPGAPSTFLDKQVSDFNRSVAPALVAAGIPTVIANQYPVLDTSASTFARAFYPLLVEGLSVAEAMRRARITLKFISEPSAIDWAVPILFTRRADEALCILDGKQSSSQYRGILTTNVNLPYSAATEKRRIGIWDINGQIAKLEQIVVLLNQCQSYYLFSVVHLSVPIGGWSDWDADDKANILRAEVFFDKLGPFVSQLNIERLLCITSFRLGAYDSEQRRKWENLYLVPDSNKGTLCIASLWKLSDKICSSGLSVGLAVTGFLVSMLAMMDAGMAAHARVPKRCPGYFNKERDIKYIAGRLEFDSRCRSHVKQASWLVFNALESMLRCDGLEAL